MACLGYEAPGHRWADAKLAWRSLRMRIGRALDESSPAEQEQLHLNDDATFHSKTGEGEKLRDQGE